MAAGDVTCQVIANWTTTTLDTAVTAARARCGASGKVLINLFGAGGCNALVTDITET